MQEKEIIPKPKGRWSYIDRDNYLLPIAEKYGRDPAGLCLKIFFGSPLKPGAKIEDFIWGRGGRIGGPILDCTKIQNICHWKGLAPRVYAIDIISWRGQRVVVQLQDYIEGAMEGENKDLFEKVAAIVKEYGGYIKDRETCWNSIAGQWLDFQIFGWKE